jgi:hypothetical protein
VKEERLKPIGEWNTYEVTALGPNISVWTNGALMNIYAGCEFRNVKLKELP